MVTIKKQQQKNKLLVVTSEGYEHKIKISNIFIANSRLKERMDKPRFTLEIA